MCFQSVVLRFVVVAFACGYVGDGVACEPPGPDQDPDAIVVYDPYSLVLSDIVVSGEADADGLRDAAVLVGRYCGAPCSTSAPPTVIASGPNDEVVSGVVRPVAASVEDGSLYYVWRARLLPLPDGELYSVKGTRLAMREASSEAAFEGAEVTSLTVPVDDPTSRAYCCLPLVGSCETESWCIHEGRYERQALKVNVADRPGFAFRWKDYAAGWSDSASLDGAIHRVPETTEPDPSGVYCAELEALNLHTNAIESSVLCAPANPDAGTLRPVSYEEIGSWHCSDGSEFVPAITSEAPSDFADLVQCESCQEPSTCPISAERCDAVRELYPLWETSELVAAPPVEAPASDAEGADDTSVVEGPSSDAGTAPSDGDATPAAEGEAADALDGAPEVTTEVPVEESADVSSADDEAAPEEVGVAEEPSSDDGGSDGKPDVAPSGMATNTSPKQDSNEQATSELSTEAELEGVDSASGSGCRLSGAPAGSPWPSAAWLTALVFALWRRRA